MEQLNKDIISLIRSAFDHSAPVISEEFDFQNLFQSYPRLAPLLIRSASLTDSFKNCPDKKSILQLVSREICINNKQKEYLDEVIKYFDKEGIFYCYLKGCEFKQLYPTPSMRPMHDCDLLIKMEQYPQIQSIMEKCGYSIDSACEHHYVWARADGYEIELHHELFCDRSEYSAINTFVDQVQEHYLIPEYSYIYMICHLAKHFKDMGPSIKNLLDLQVYRMAHKDLDWDLINRYLNDLSLTTFHEAMLRTLRCWFDDGVWGEVEENITEVVLQKYDIKKERTDRIFNARFVSQSEFSLKSFIQRCAFPPITLMRLRFPILESLPILLPFLWIYRIFYLIFDRNGKYKEKKELLSSSEKEYQSSYQQFMNSLELHYQVD